MSIISKLAILLTADSTRLKSDFDKGLRAAQDFKSSISRVLDFTSLAGVPGLGALGAAVTGAFSVSSIKESIDGMVDLQKEAVKLGTTVEDLSKLMTLEGPDFTSEAMLTGIRKLKEATQDALDPRSEKGKLFAKAGLDPVAMLGAGTLGSLKMFADAMERTTSSGERLKLALGAMGKTGHDMVSFLSQGSSAITSAMAEAERKGQAVTLGMARDAKAAAAALDDLGDAWTKIKNKLATGVAPGATGFLKGAEKLLSGDATAKDFGKAVIDVVNPMGPIERIGSRQGRAAADEAREQEERTKAAKEYSDVMESILQQNNQWRKDMDAATAGRKEELQNRFGRPIHGAIDWAKGAMTATDQFFRKGEGQMMRREEERQEKIAASAKDIFLNSAKSVLPQAAEFGSSEAADALAAASATNGMTMEQATRQALAENTWQESLAQKFAAHVATVLPRMKMATFDGGHGGH